MSQCNISMQCNGMEVSLMEKGKTKQNDDAWEGVKKIRAWAHWSFSTLSIRHADLTADRETLHSFTHSFIQLSSTTLTWHVGADPVPRIQSMNHSVMMNKLFQLSSTTTTMPCLVHLLSVFRLSSFPFLYAHSYSTISITKSLF